MSNTSLPSDSSSEASDRFTRREFLRRSTVLGLAGVGAGTFLAACGGGSESPTDEAASQAGETDTAEATPAGEADRTVTLHPEGNNMRYRETEFTVAPGETVEIVFENTATSPSMQHNVVVLNSTEDEVFQRVGEAGMQAGSANDYVPEDDAIIAHTPMSKPGETVSTTFTTPEETGDYGYVCTYPGHWATMQGTMHVEEGAEA